MRKIYSLLTAMVLGACANGQHSLEHPFKPEDHQAYAGKGTGRVEGAAYVSLPGGKKATCGGNPVMLIPATPYFAEIMTAVQKGEKLAPESQAAFRGVMEQQEQYKDFSRKAHCNKHGHFTFTRLPAELWYAVTSIGMKTPQGARVIVVTGSVQAREGQTAKLEMTNK